LVGSAKDEANVVVIKVAVVDRQGGGKVNANEVIITVDGSGDSVRQLSDALAGKETVTADNKVWVDPRWQRSWHAIAIGEKKKLILSLASNTVDENRAINVGISRDDVSTTAEARQRTRSQVLVGEAIRVRVKAAVEAITSEASIAYAAMSGVVNGGKLGTNGGARGRYTKDGATSLNTLSVGTAAA
jgi:hypothetical protein